MATDARAGQLVTLSTASTVLGKPDAYFRIRRNRFRMDAKHPFPEPVTRLAGVDVFDLQTLVLWDAKRKTMTKTKKDD
jgi:hypothetical protein